MFGNPNVGVYAIVSDDYVIVPRHLLKRTKNAIEKILNAQVIATDIGQSRIIGVLAAANANGLCVPPYTMESEISFLKTELDIQVERIPTELTALGNNILCNDRRALVNPEMDRISRNIIADTLGVEVVSGKIAKYNTVGSASIITNKGTLLPSQCNEEEVRWIKELFGTSVGIGTINAGFHLIGSGLIANVHGAIAGELTTGPELARVGLVLEL